MPRLRLLPDRRHGGPEDVIPLDRRESAIGAAMGALFEEAIQDGIDALWEFVVRQM